MIDKKDLYFESNDWDGCSVLKKRSSSFSCTESRKFTKLEESRLLDDFFNSQEEKREDILNFNSQIPVFQEVNYDSVIFPLDPLPFPEIKVLLKPKNIKYSYDEIKYLKNNKNIISSKLIKLFCNKFNKKMNAMAFYRLKITCVYNPIVVDENIEWHHIINRQGFSKIQYDEDLLASFIIQKLTHEKAYECYCSAHPNEVSFHAFTKKMSVKKNEE